MGNLNVYALLRSEQEGYGKLGDLVFEAFTNGEFEGEQDGPLST